MIKDVVIGKIYTENTLLDMVAKNSNLRLITKYELDGFNNGKDKCKIIDIIDGIDVIKMSNGVNVTNKFIRNIIIDKVVKS